MGAYRSVRRIFGRRIRRIAVVLYRNSDMRALHRALDGGGFTGRYRLACGTLLGWARENRLIPWDPDVDFFVDYEDLQDFFNEALPTIAKAGFRPRFLFRNNKGDVTEISFYRHLLRYDFFFTYPTAEEGVSSYFAYTWVEGPGGPVNHIQLTNSFCTQPWVECDLLGKVWMKPADHHAELTAHYGSWRVPDKDYVHTQSQDRAREDIWLFPDAKWPGSLRLNVRQ